MPSHGSGVHVVMNSEQLRHGKTVSSERWIAAQLSLAIPCGHIDASEFFEQPSGLRLLKAISEITYFSLYGAFYSAPEYLDCLTGIICNIFRDKQFFNLLRFNPKYSTLFLPLFDVAVQLNVLTPIQQADVVRLSEIYAPRGPERVPHRTMDLLYGLQNVGLEIPESQWQSAISSGCSGSSDRLRWLGMEDAYALTHTIFYRTDFGRVPETFSSSEKEWIAQSLERLARYAICTDQNADLLAEYLLCFGYLNCYPPIVDEIRNTILNLQQPQGYWQAPGLLNDQLVGLGVPSNLFPFYNHYHTTILASQAIHVSDCNRPNRRTRVFPNFTSSGSSASSLSQTTLLSKLKQIECPYCVCELLWLGKLLEYDVDEITNAIAAEMLCFDLRDSNPTLASKFCLLLNPTESPTLVQQFELATKFDYSKITIDHYEQLFAQISLMNAAGKRNVLLDAVSCLSITLGPSLYVRFAALAIVYQVCDEILLDQILETIDGYYSSEGTFLWSERSTSDCFSQASDLIGRMVLTHFKDHPIRADSRS